MEILVWTILHISGGLIMFVVIRGRTIALDTIIPLTIMYANFACALHNIINVAKGLV